MSYLLDTNVISELVRSNPDKNVSHWFSQVPDETLHISVLTLGEIRKSIEKVSNATRKEKFRIWLEHKLPEWFKERILSIDHLVAERWGKLQSEMKRPLPAIDSLIAATALHYDLNLVTRNVSDFQYPSLTVINPWEKSH